MFGTIKNWGLKETIILMRILIGWHFLYEGVIKMYNPEWTSFGYLATAQGPFQSIFAAIANEPYIGIADGLNKFALVFVGITFLLGIFEKAGAIVAAGLLLLYYLAHPPFPWLEQIKVEGAYWFVNKNLIELVACMVIYQFPTGKYFGLQHLFDRKKEITKSEAL
ncbi:MAG: DoxX subfamily [Flavobacteriaceae bacterium]|nr:DoxX subfamily [Flavobacteriaceae bacterium]